MLVFIVTSSSVGKTRLLAWLKHNIRGSLGLSADAFLDKHRNVLAKNSTVGPWVKFNKTDWKEQGVRAGRQELVAAGRSKNVHFIDTIVRGLEGDLAYIKKNNKSMKITIVYAGVEL